MIGRIVRKEYDLTRLWNKYILERFIELALLSDDEEAVIRSLAASWSRVKISCKYNMSIATVDRIIQRLKIKYDCVQKYDQDLPPRSDIRF